jgi:basic membrane protein A and related proteins
LRSFSKIAAVVVVAAMALSGCGDSGGSGGGSSSASKDVCKSATDGDGPKVGIAYDIGGRGDQSFNDSAYRGLTKAVEDLDATCIEAKATTSDNDTTRAERLRTLAEGGYNPVISIGYLYSPAAAKVAAEMPDTNFAVIDGYSTTLTKSPLENLNDLVFAAHEGAYLVGVAAGLKSKAKHVGFVGGVPGNVIGPFEAGYKAGVKSVDPKIKVDTTYLTQDQTDAAAAYENTSGGKAAATAMYEGGADVVFHAAGKSGIGVFQAVEAAGDGKWAIGVDSDQYLTASKGQQPHILTSALKRIDTAVYDEVKSFQDKTLKPGFVNYDLKSDGVGYATSGGYVDDIEDQLQAEADKIKSGEIKVPTDPKQVK